MAAQAHGFVQKKWNKLTSSNYSYAKNNKKYASIADFENNPSG